jgi:hypothetical protein
MAINPLVHTQSIASNHQSNPQFKKICQIFAVFAMVMKKLLLKTMVKSVKIAKELKQRLNF